MNVVDSASLSTHERHVALFGFPLAHSVSPAMHHAAAASLELPLQYHLWPLPEAELPAAVHTLRQAHWLGANITVPHKVAILPYLDGVSSTVERIGALNTLYKRDGRLLGENTDAPALVRSLQSQLSFNAPDECVVVLGAGGAARAAVFTLANSGVRAVGVWNRTSGKAALLVASLSSSGLSASISHVTTPTLVPWLRKATLVINATSAGLDGASTPVDLHQLSAPARVYDLGYGPTSAPLLAQAKLVGLEAADGLWMLVYQAAASFRLWFGVDPPEQLMYAASVAALKARGWTGESGTPV